MTVNDHLIMNWWLSSNLNFQILKPLQPDVVDLLWFLKKDLSRCHKLKFCNSYIFATSWCKPTIFQTVMNSLIRFIICHYAGEVNYNSAGFIEKNKDILFLDLINLMKGSTSHLVKSLFKEEVQWNT